MSARGAATISKPAVDVIEAARLSALLDMDSAADAAAREYFWRWFERVYLRPVRDDALLAEGLAAWGAVANKPEVMAWWRRCDACKPALPVTALLRGLAGVARIEPAEFGWYSPPDPRGSIGLPAITWTVCEGDPARALDIVAMDPGDPARWWRRTCCAEILPGEMELELLDAGAAIRLYETPLAWLAAGCPARGFCVLDWAGRIGQGLLADLDAGRYTAVCDSDAHARRVRSLARPKRAPMKLGVESGARERADKEISHDV